MQKLRAVNEVGHEAVEKVEQVLEEEVDHLSRQIHDLAQPIMPAPKPRFSVEQLEQAFKKRLHRKQRRARRLAFLGIGLWLGSLLVVALGVMPSISYALFPETAAQIAAAIGETADIEKSGFGEALYETQTAPEPFYVPPFDASLPAENMLIVPEIGIKAVINEGEYSEEILRQGVWRAPDFGDPEDRRLPVMLAAHRFGYLAWTNQFRRENSFYNLPKIENGDRIELIWNQRKYVFEVFEGYTDTQLQDLDADLILFTCQVLNSDQRIIRKARLIVPESFDEYTQGEAFGEL